MKNDASKLNAGSISGSEFVHLHVNNNMHYKHIAACKCNFLSPCFASQLPSSPMIVQSNCVLAEFYIFHHPFSICFFSGCSCWPITSQFCVATMLTNLAISQRVWQLNEEVSSCFSEALHCYQASQLCKVWQSDEESSFGKTRAPSTEHFSSSGFITPNLSSPDIDKAMELLCWSWLSQVEITERLHEFRSFCVVWLVDWLTIRCCRYV